MHQSMQQLSRYRVWGLLLLFLCSYTGGVVWVRTMLAGLCSSPQNPSTRRTGSHALLFPISFFCRTLPHARQCVPPAPPRAAPAPVCVCPHPHPADTVDNYSLLISPAVCCPDTMFFVLVRHLEVHPSLYFLGGRALCVPSQRELQHT